MTNSTSPQPAETIEEIIEPPLEWSDVTSVFTRAGEWISDNSVEILIAIAIGTAVFLAFEFIGNRAKKYAERHPERLALPAIAARAVGRTSHFFMFMLSVRLVSGVAGMSPLAESVVSFLFIVAVAFQVAIWVRELILGVVERRASDGEEHGSETLTNALTLIKLIVTIVLFAIAAIVVLDNVGVDVTGLIAGLGVGGIAIGLAAQGIFSDLFAALAIIFDKPFKRGETIQYDNTVATVEATGLKSTRLRSVTGEEIVISNTNLLDKEIINYTRLDRRRTRFGIGVIYQTDPEKARKIPGILQEIVERHDAVFIRAGFVGFGDSSINFELDFDIMSDDYAVVFEGRHMIGLEILQKFNELGYEFAYPTQTTFTAAPDGEMIMPYPKEGFGLIEK